MPLLPASSNSAASSLRTPNSSFTCLTVLNKKGVIRQREKDLLLNTVDLIHAYGASKIVYVRENNNNSGFFLRSLKDFQTDFTVDNAKNIQEAEDILDEKKSGK